MAFIIFVNLLIFFCVEVENICNQLLKYTGLSCYSMAGLQWLPRDPSMVPDILITTPDCFAENFKRTVNQNRHRNFLTRIQWVVMDEADMLLVKNVFLSSSLVSFSLIRGL